MCLGLLFVAAAATACSTRAENQQSKMIVRSLQASDVKVGLGAEAKDGQTVTIDYTVWLYDSSQPARKGRRLDSTLDRHVPVTFRLGAGQMIPAFDMGIPGMKVGGTRELFVPPMLGFADKGNGPIPPNATLVYDIILRSAVEPSAPAAPGQP
ncbi:MAG TPA: FKBP-type peptidyl-prolyl cis-trans isomerase [Vicinamibacterales bacterium]|nr:FKBP-type peptidyl-prolyl cis-trans isomerase [Vicinamibacterales bacterium]